MPGQCNIFLYLISIVEKEITNISVDKKIKSKQILQPGGRLNSCKKVNVQNPPISLHLSDDFFPCILGKVLKLDAFSGPYLKSLA